MSMLFSGSEMVQCAMYYCARDSEVIRLEIYGDGKDVPDIIAEWGYRGYVVTKAIDTPHEISGRYQAIRVYNKYAEPTLPEGTQQ